jgi:hypothetical protein
LLYCVYRCETADLNLSSDERFVFRKITDCELDQIAEYPDTAYQKTRCEVVGRNLAYGLFDGSTVASIAWLIPWQQHASMRGRVLHLQSGQAEITTCYTRPEYRGMGLYPLIIRYLCRLGSTEYGVNRIYMITTIDNTASQRGIQKAGLSSCGYAFQYILPLMPSRSGVVLPMHS